MSSSGGDPSTDRAASFAEALPPLKQRGCSVLVVGTVPGEVHEHACERLLGDDTAETRRRLTVRASHEEGLGIRVADESESSARMIEHDVNARAPAVGAEGAAEADTTGIGETGPVGPSEADAPPGAGAESEEAGRDRGVVGLGERVATAVGEIEATAGGLSPAELRVCFDSLLALVDAHDHETVTRLLRPVFAAVRDVCGMAHCHLPVARDAEVVDALAPEFDAVVELGVELGCPRQRWHLRDGPSSEWLPLASPTADTRGVADE